MVGGVVIGDVPQRMAAGVDDVEAGFAEFDDVAVLHHAVRSDDLLHLLGPHGDGAGRRRDLGVAAGVVGVPVGVEDEGQLPAQPVDLAQDGGGVRGVDAGGQPARLVADQEAVVVGEAGELVDGQGHGLLSCVLRHARWRAALDD